jgi:hypothetical protein
VAEKTMLDVIRVICARGCAARVDLLSQRRDPHFWVMAIGPNGGVLSGVPAEPNDGAVHGGSYRHFIDDLDDPRTWATVGEAMPERMA